MYFCPKEGQSGLLPRHQVKYADEVGNIDLTVAIQVGSGIILALCHQIKNAHGIGNVNLAVAVQVTLGIRECYDAAETAPRRSCLVSLNRPGGEKKTSL